MLSSGVFPLVHVSPCTRLVYHRTYHEPEVSRECSDLTAADETIVLNPSMSASPWSMTLAKTYGIPYSDGCHTFISHISQTTANNRLTNIGNEEIYSWMRIKSLKYQKNL